MGGDHAPAMVVDGAARARERYPDVHYLMVGDEAAIKPLLERNPGLGDRVTLVHTADKIESDMRPSQALRNGKQSSMALAIDAVREGEARCVVSAGNTGALMAISKFKLKTLEGIDRPAIASFFPTSGGESCMLDLGANIQCDAKNLVEFAVMGGVFARTVLGIGNPSVGLLNVGVEDMKGHEELREAAAILREKNLPIDFKGFIEGNDIGKGVVDVVVSDGFTGNVALKSAEGTATLYTTFLRQAFMSSLTARLGYLLAQRALNKLRVRTDPRRYNGAMLLGLNGIVVKSHGGTDDLGFANAVGVAVDMAKHGFLDKIVADFATLRAQDAEPEPSPEAVG